MAQGWNYHPTIRERKDRKVNPYKSDFDFVLDDLEYTDYYKKDGSTKELRDIICCDSE